jgi:hypothetical protein
MNSDIRLSLRVGLWAALYLIGPIFLTFVIAFGIGALPFHIDMGQAAPFFVALFLLLCTGGGWLWGTKLAGATGAPEPERLGAAVAFSHNLIVVAAAIGLGNLERVFVEQGASSLPVHVIFAILFGSATLVVGAVLGLAVGIALRSGPMAWRLALGSSLGGALAFLLIDLLLDSLGRRVGGPNAAATATMLTTALAGGIAAAITAGAWCAWLIRRLREPAQTANGSP